MSARLGESIDYLLCVVDERNFSIIFVSSFSKRIILSLLTVVILIVINHKFRRKHLQALPMAPSCIMKIQIKNFPEIDAFDFLTTYER